MPDKTRNNNGPRQLGHAGGAVVLLAALLLAISALGFIYHYIKSGPSTERVPTPERAALIQAPGEEDGGRPGPGAEAAPEDLGYPEESDFSSNGAGEGQETERRGTGDQRRAAALNESAVREARAGRLDEAAALLREAATLSSDPAILINLARVQARRGELEDAAISLEAASGDPGAQVELKRIYRMLGRERYSKGDLSGAAEFLEKALALDSSDRGLRAELARVAGEKEAEDMMGRREGSRFVVRFEGGENAVAGYVIGIILEEAYIKVGSELGLWPEERVEALLYSRDAFRDITRSPSWAGAIYDGRIKLPAGGITEKTALLERVIYHEYVHAVVKEASKGRAPVWLNEGIAQYLEGRSTSGYEEVLGRAAASGPGLKSLEGSFMGLRSDQAELAYLLSLSATEYLIREFGIFSVRNILENLGRGLGVDEAVHSAVHLTYRDFERAWKDSLARR